MKEVHLRVSGVYRSNWSKNIENKSLNEIYGYFVYLLNFVEDKEGILCLDSDSLQKYENLLSILSSDIEKAELAKLLLPHWNQGEMLIENLDDGKVAGFNINSLWCLKQCRDYVKDKLHHAELPSNSVANLKRSTSFHPDVAVVNNFIPVGHGETSACIVYGLKTSRGLVMDRQVSFNLRFICKNGHSWGLIDEKDPLGNYNDSLGEYEIVKEMFKMDMEELQKAGDSWYFGRAVVQSKYKWEHDSSVTTTASFPVASFDDFVHVNKYVKESLPWFKWPFGGPKKETHFALQTQAAPIVHDFSRNDDKQQPLITKPEPEQDSETPSRMRLLKQSLCC